MGSNYKNKMSYEVDLVFCIDATMSMDPILDKVKSNALNFYQDFQKEMDEKGKRSASFGFGSLHSAIIIMTGRMR